MHDQTVRNMLFNSKTGNLNKRVPLFNSVWSGQWSLYEGIWCADTVSVNYVYHHSDNTESMRENICIKKEEQLVWEREQGLLVMEALVGGMD